MPMHLTEEQARTLRQSSAPVEVIDPETQRAYILLAREQYECIRHLLSTEGSAPAAVSPAIPSGIRRSQEAYWRELPQLLRTRNHLGKWVCYHGDERIGIGTHEELIRECLRRGLPDDAYDLGVIAPRDRPPWEPEEVRLRPQDSEDSESLSPPTQPS
jgi:hypothetical protein